MKKNFKITLLALLILAVSILGAQLLVNSDLVVLNPKGEIGQKQKDLFNLVSLLMLIVVIPVFVLATIFTWKYRIGSKNAKYSPDWNHSYLAETIWWGIPFVIIIILSMITWKSCHELDPYKPLTSDAKPIKIQVVALQWKWLFIYPEEQIACVNYLQFSEQTPLNFEITSDAPMNSFWIPQLGGQIYAMSGMRSKLHLIANETGTFRGCSANISGKGFSGMNFIAKSSTEAEFKEWIASVKASSNPLDLEKYNQLMLPSENNPQTFYNLVDEGLFDQIIMKYKNPPLELQVKE